MSRPLIIGLTGGIASGKTTVANYLQQCGAYLIDTDVIARQVVAPDSPTTIQISELLGSDFLFADGNLNRPKIKERIFNDEVLKSRYEGIIMPAIRRATLSALDSAPQSADYVLLIVPLLFEKGLHRYCDYTISVDIPVDEQIQRAITRNPNDKAVIEQIISAQLPREVRNSRANFIIDNTLPLEKLFQQLDILHQQLCQLPLTRQNTKLIKI